MEESTNPSPVPSNCTSPVCSDPAHDDLALDSEWATARIALLKTLKITTFPMFEYVTMKFEKFDKIYYVFLEQTLQKF